MCHEALKLCDRCRGCVNASTNTDIEAAFTSIDDGLPIIAPALFKKIELIEDEQLTRVCQSLCSMEKVRICEDLMLDAYCTTDGQSILGRKFCPDVLFVRSFYEKLFQVIRGMDHAILIGNPGISKSV